MIADPVHVVTQWDTGEVRSIFVFADFDDAQAFRLAAVGNGKDAVYDEQIIISRAEAVRFIAEAA